MSKWYVLYTRKGWEKKVSRLLEEKGLECFCPLLNVQKKWSDRMKTLTEPLFHTHIFVKMQEEQRSLVRLTQGVKNFVYANGRPVFIRKKEVQVLRQMLVEFDIIKVYKQDATNGLTQTATESLIKIKKDGYRIKQVKLFIGDTVYRVHASALRPNVMPS